MENQGHQWMFSLCNNVREENVINLKSSMFDIVSMLKIKSYEIEEIGDNSELPNSSDDSYDSDESYISARNEMKEDDDDDDTFYAQRSGRFILFPEDNVYVAVGKGKSSIDALSWMLNNCIRPSTNIYLIHILPETRYIPSPMGLVAKQNVSAKIVDKYKNQERNKAKAFVQEILDACSSPFDIQNKVNVMLVESDGVGKTLLNLITFLKINKLVIGAHAPKHTSRTIKIRKNGVAHYMFINKPTACDVKLVCGGKEVIDPLFATPFTSPASSQYWPSPARPSNSRNSSWFRKSKSVADFQKSELQLGKSKSFADFQKSKLQLDKSKSCTDFQML